MWSSPQALRRFLSDAANGAAPFPISAQQWVPGLAAMWAGQSSTRLRSSSACNSNAARLPIRKSAGLFPRGDGQAETVVHQDQVEPLSVAVGAARRRRLA
jgi:hypothetical protein